jgi:hypothetical protein
MSRGSRAMGPPPATIPCAHLPSRDDGLLAAGKTHVARQGDLADVAGRTAADECDGRNRQAGQTHKKVRPRRQACGALRQRGQVFNLGREIRVIQEVLVDRAVKDHDPRLLVGLKSVDDFLELLDHFWTHDVDRRVVDRDTPIGGRPSGQANLCGFRGCVHLSEFGRCAHSRQGIFLPGHSARTKRFAQLDDGIAHTFVSPAASHA